MNILVINPMIYTAPPKGAPISRRKSIADSMICNFCQGFVANGHNVTLIASAEYRPTEEETFDFEIVYLENSIAKYIPKFPHGLPVLNGLRKYLKQNRAKYDIVISSELFTFHSITAARVCPEKLMIWQEFGHHHIFFHEIPSRIWHNTTVRLFIKKRVVVVPRSSVAGKFARRYCDIVSDEVVNNSVDTRIFRYNAEKDNFLIVVSRLVPGKNIHYIIEKYIHYIKKYKSEMRLLIIGDGPERIALERYIQTNGFADRITFTGWVRHRDFADLLSRATGFLCCTIRELNMISITEALACGTPVLTNRVPLQREMIAEYGLGIVKGDWTEDDIHKLVENSPEYVRNCKAVCGSFSSIEAAASMIRIFRKFRRVESIKQDEG